MKAKQSHLQASHANPDQAIKASSNSNAYFSDEPAAQEKEEVEENIIFNIIDYIRVGCSLLRSGTRHRALAQTIGNARGLDINSPQSAENHP
jgi:hypothetical protein